MKTSDRDIRQVLHDNLAQHYAGNPNTIILHELQVCQGEARVDIALVNGQLHGFEIKSDKDTLERLPKQMLVYSRVFDTVTLVTGEVHLEEAVLALPDWWGILVASMNRAGTRVTNVRSAEDNPETNIDAFSLAQFLWRGELLELLRLHGLDKGVSRVPRFQLWSVVAENLSMQVIKDYVKRCLKMRQSDALHM